MYKFLDKHFFKIFQIFIFIIFILPLLAPIFAHFGPKIFAQVIYFIYSYSCHQLAHRSLHFFDYQVAWCVRDTFIWGGVLLSTILIPKFKLTRFNIFFAIPFIIPIALDGGIQTIATMLGVSGGNDFYTSTNLTRAITGAIFGIGVGLFLTTMIYSVSAQESIKYDKKYLKRFLLFFATSMTILIFLYMALVQFWRVTSKTYKPKNFVDYEIRKQDNPDAWIRQAHGLCKPNPPKDILGTNGVEGFIFAPKDCF